MSLAFLSLLRIKTLAQSGNISCGELGRVIGLDRIPEVKTLRNRIAFFANTGNVKQWTIDLSRLWLNNNEELSGILYIDGHVNIYYGHQTQMPKRYVSRMRLCMSGSTDYYVNDCLGQPFFVVNKEVNGSMIEKIKKEIVPQLLLDLSLQSVLQPSLQSVSLQDLQLSHLPSLLASTNLHGSVPQLVPALSTAKPASMMVTKISNKNFFCIFFSVLLLLLFYYDIL